MTFWDTLRTGDAFPEDWYAWATNQAAHFAVVGLPAGFLCASLGLPGAGAVLLVMALYAALWEGWAQNGKDLLDAVADTGFVGLGVAFIFWAGWTVLVVAALALAVGIYRRAAK